MLFACRVNRFFRAFTVANSHFSSSITNFPVPARIIRPISNSVLRLHPKNEHSRGQGPGRAGSSKDAGRVQEESFSRTDDEVQILHPDEKHMPRSTPGVGRSGSHFKRTLASFSLDGRVAVVTGGARGLGLVMAQALMVSGADIAIVDLNSKQDCRLRQPLYLCPSQRRKGLGRRKSWWICSGRRILTRTSTHSDLVYL